MDLPGVSTSCWVASAPTTSYPPYTHSGRADVAVIGAGIVGLTAAYLLAKAGHAVTVLEARKVGRQVTGRSTAKITTQHALVYAHLLQTLGEDRARAYADANRSGMQQIIDLATALRIDCDLERKDAYAYTLRANRRGALAREAKAAIRLGLDAEVLDAAPLPFATAGGLRFASQAQFNPAKYLVGLAAAVVDASGQIFEDTRVDKIVKARKGHGWSARSGRHHLDAERIVVATNVPIGGPIPFDRQTQPRSHVAMAYRVESNAPIDGMFIGVDQPAHSLRMGCDREGPLLVVLGPKFKSGQEGDVAKRFRQLDAWVRERIPVGDVVWRWVNEDYDSPDRVPFAGELAKKAPGMHVATGFNAWGISNGAAAGLLIVDQIEGRGSPWTAVYDPERRAPKDFNISSDSQSIVESVDEIEPGHGGVIERGKKKIAVWKSDDGRAHALDAACTHKGCTVTWNNADRTWDCPCHGSMFTREGEVIHGPATDPLKPVRLPAR